MFKRNKIAVYIGFFLFFISFSVQAQQASRVYEGTWNARVVETMNQTKTQVPGSNKALTIQALKAEILNGPKKGEVVFIEGDYMKLKTGDRFLVNYYINNDVEVFTVNEPERRPFINGLICLFMAVILWFGGKQGLRSIISLCGAFLAIFYVLLPALLAGWPPVLVSTAVAVVVLFAAIFFTHGFNRGSAIAYVGTISAVAITAILAGLSVYLMKFTGFASDGSITLNFRIAQQLDFVGLLLGGIIIGVLGVLDDIAITQVAVVRELMSDTSLTKKDVYKKALRVGREHVGALVNTLALAYTGAALPMLILMYASAYSPSVVLNQEVFASEVLRVIVGSIGLVLAVPITTLLAVRFYKHTDISNDKEVHVCSHGHSH